MRLGNQQSSDPFTGAWRGEQGGPARGGVVTVAILRVSALPNAFLLLSLWEASSIKRKRPEEFATILNI